MILMSFTSRDRSANSYCYEDISHSEGARQIQFGATYIRLAQRVICYREKTRKL